MTTMTEPPKLEDEQYMIVPTRFADDARQLWWDNMKAVQWNRSNFELDTYISSSQSSGWQQLVPKSSGKPEGHIQATIFDNSTGWVSMFIVSEDHRGLGYGSALFKAAMADFETHGTQIIGLDAVPEQKQTYERRGFVESPLGMLAYMKRGLVAKAALPSSTPMHDSFKLVDIKTVPREKLVSLDLELTGLERKGLWTADFFERADVFGYAVILTGEDGPDFRYVKAWVIVRRCPSGFRFGPVFGTSADVTRMVMNAAMEHATVEKIKQNVLEDDPHSDLSDEEVLERAELVAEVWFGNAKGRQLFEDLGWEHTGIEYYRMWYKGKATEQQDKDGETQQGMYAIFDAAIS